MTPRTRMALAWTVWAGAFAVLETVTVRRGDDTALCNYLRPILGTRGHPAHKAAGAVVLAAFAVWFPIHLYKQES